MTVSDALGRVQLMSLTEQETGFDLYRFVVVYRREKGGTKTSNPVWRGWIEKVYPVLGDEDCRYWFEDISEVSEHIKNSIPLSGKENECND